MGAEPSPSFPKWRSFFWPIHRQELSKFLPMFLMFFFISFNYNALRSYKDTIIVTASHSGAEAIPFIKVWAVLPSALLMTFIFTRLANALDREKVFYIIMSSFLAFFVLFALVLYPAQDILHPNGLADSLQSLLPAGCKGLIAVFRNWTFTLFYIFSELWSTTIFTVLFWGFANEVTTVGEAKRFYGIIGTGGNIAGIFSGHAAIYFSGNLFYSWLPYGKTAWDQSIFFFTATIVLFGIFTMLIFRWLNKKVIRPSEQNNPHFKPPEKIKLSMRQNFRYLAKSKYLICIALVVLTYNLAMNLVEVVWKNQLKELYPNPNDYNTYMGQIMVWMGVIATLTGLIGTSNIIRRFSWTACAIIAPITVGLTGLLFFTFVLSDSPWIPVLFGVSPLMLTVTLGSIQNCLSRAAKYTVFDATKEIAFIPLSPSSKLKGKAAIDGVGSRLGKSGGSVIHQGLLLMFSTFAATTPFVAVIFVVIIAIWGTSVLSLGKQFEQLTAEKTKLDVPDQPALVHP